MSALMLLLYHFIATILLALVVAETLHISTPANVVQCLPVLITWTGGTSPYVLLTFLCLGFTEITLEVCAFLLFASKNKDVVADLVDLGKQEDMSMTWIVNITGGTSVMLYIRDSSGTVAETGKFAIQSSSYSSCSVPEGAKSNFVVPTSTTSYNPPSESKIRIATIVPSVLAGCIVFGGIMVCIRRNRLPLYRILCIRSPEQIFSGKADPATSDIDSPAVGSMHEVWAAYASSRRDRDSGSDSRREQKAEDVLPSSGLQHATVIKPKEPVYLTYIRPTELSEDGTFVVTDYSSPLPLTPDPLIERGSQFQRIGWEANEQSSTPRRFLPASTGDDALLDTPPARRVSLMMSEIRHLCAQIAEVMRHQQQETSRESRPSSSAGDDSQMAPPAYSEEGES